MSRLLIYRKGQTSILVTKLSVALKYMHEERVTIGMLHCQCQIGEEWKQLAQKLKNSADLDEQMAFSRRHDV